jgi:hypothetical protein
VDGPIPRLKLVHRHAEPRGGAHEQALSRLGGYLLEPGTGVLDRLAAGCPAIIGGELRVAHDHGDALEWHVERAGDDLGEGGPYPGAQLDFAGKKRNETVGVDRQPGIDRG